MEEVNIRMADPPSSANSDENPPHSLRSYDHKHAKTMTDGLARQQVSCFETLIHFMLRRSLSARGGVMSRKSQCIDTEELRKR
jgi:hypothetical protein